MCTIRDSRWGDDMEISSMDDMITQRRRCISCGGVGCICAIVIYCTILMYNVGILFVSSWTLIGDG